jgi:ACS family hexuronate transporter-like MFS transporter
MIGLFTNPYIAIGLLCLGGFAHQTLAVGLISLTSDSFGRNEIATAMGLVGMTGWLASTIFALIVGVLADIIGFSPLFVMLAVFDLLAVLSIWTILKSRSSSQLKPTEDGA